MYRICVTSHSNSEDSRFHYTREDPTDDTQRTNPSQINCTFSGDEKLIQTNVAYPVECQNILVTLGPAIDADYFAFDGTDGTCTLYKGDDRDCDIFSGPDYPEYIAECSGANATEIDAEEQEDMY